MILIPIISIPKSGTHLLREVFIQLYPGLKPQLTWWMYTDKNNILLGEEWLTSKERKEDRKYLMDLNDWQGYFESHGKGGQTISVACPSHMMWDLGAADYFDQHRKTVYTIFNYRDPRDIMVAFIRGLEQGIKTIDKRVKTYVREINKEKISPERKLEKKYITLLDKGVGNRDYGGYRAELDLLVAWKNHEPVFSISYEQLMSEDKDAIRGLSEHIKEDDDNIIQALQVAKTIKTETRRKATVRQWVDDFTPAVKQRVKATLGDLLIELGYERNNDW